MTCNTCGTKFSSSETLSTHISNAHKRKENVDCGNWICMEETGSCGGYCVYNIPIPLKSSKNKDQIQIIIWLQLELYCTSTMVIECAQAVNNI